MVLSDEGELHLHIWLMHQPYSDFLVLQHIHTTAQQSNVQQVY